MHDMYDRQVIERAEEVLGRSRSVASGLLPQECVSSAEKLSKHYEALTALPLPPKTWLQKVRWGWHEGWATAHVVRYERYEPLGGP